MIVCCLLGQEIIFLSRQAKIESYACVLMLPHIGSVMDIVYMKLHVLLNGLFSFSHVDPSN